MTPLEVLKRVVTPVEAAALLDRVREFIGTPYDELLQRLLFQRDTAVQVKQVIDLLADSFPNDPSSPSVVFSRLENGKYYGSLVRYNKPFGQEKQVLHKTSADTFEEVLALLLQQLGVSDGEGRD